MSSPSHKFAAKGTNILSVFMLDQNLIAYQVYEPISHHGIQCSPTMFKKSYYHVMKWNLRWRLVRESIIEKKDKSYKIWAKLSSSENELGFRYPSVPPIRFSRFKFPLKQHTIITLTFALWLNLLSSHFTTAPGPPNGITGRVCKSRKHTSCRRLHICDTKLAFKFRVRKILRCESSWTK